MTADEKGAPFWKVFKQKFLKFDDRPEKSRSEEKVSEDGQALDHQEQINRISKQKALLLESQIAQGKLAYEKGLLHYKQFKFREALNYFEEARFYMPEDQDVKSYIQKCRKILGEVSGSPLAVTDWVVEGKSVLNQELSLKVDYHLDKGEGLIKQAIESWERDDLGKEKEAQVFLIEAEQEYRKARSASLRLETGRGKKENRIRAGEKRIQKLQQAWNSYFKTQRVKRSKEKAERLNRDSEEDEKKEILALLTKAKKSFLDKDFDRSIEFCQLLLEKSPEHKEALKILERSHLRRSEKLAKKIRKRSELEWRKNIEKIRESSLVYSDTIVYPENWHEIKRRKAIEVKRTSEPEWQKQMKQKMKLPVNLQLVDRGILDILGLIQDQTGINFVVDPALDLEEALIVQMNLKDTPTSSALELILRNIDSESPLIYQLRNEAVYITTRENQIQFSSLERILYDVTDLITSFGDQKLPENGGLGTGQGLSRVSEDTEDTETITTETLIELITATIAPETWEVEGVSIEPPDPGKMMVVQTHDVHEEINKLLSAFRQQQKLQVSIEVRFISSSDDDLFDIGVDWNQANEVQLEDSGVVSGTGTYSSRTSLDSDTRVATILGSAADATVSGAPDFIASNRASQGLLGEVAVLDPIRAGLALHALSRKEKIRDLLAPRLTVLNNKQGYFLRSVDSSYVRTYTNSDGNLTPNIDRVSSGEILVVRPTVSSDRKYITMDLSPQVTKVISFDNRQMSIPVQTNNGGGANQVNNFQIFNVSVELPRLEVWQMQTRVQVPDGGVVFVGGRMGNQESKSTRGVPILSKVPLLGRLFRSDGEYTRLENLLISVRAKVLLIEELEDRVP